MSSAQAKSYGLLLGSAAATAFALGVEHIGWIVGAALFVVRHDRGTQ